MVPHMGSTWSRSILPDATGRSGRNQLTRLQRRQHVGGVNIQLVEAHVVEAEIRRRRMQWPERAIAEQLFQPRGLEDAVRAAERQRRAGDPAHRLADYVFGSVKRGSGF